jgi:hypothetical protein
VDDTHGRPKPKAPSAEVRQESRKEAKRPLEDLPRLEVRLPPYLALGNRYATAGLIGAVVGLLCSLVSFLQFVGWVSATAGAVFASIGFVKYCRGGATNRDAAAIGVFLAWLALVILLTRASVALGLPMVPAY